RQEVRGVATNQSLTLRQSDAGASGRWQAAGNGLGNTPDAGMASPPDESTIEPYFVFVPDRLGLDFIHQEDDFVDFRREPLLPHMHSRLGPPIASADVNGDRLVDVYVGGAAGQAGALYLQQADGSFRQLATEAFEADAPFEDVDAIFFDADGDGDPDLYVVSGGSHALSDDAYVDRLYFNEGFGRFVSSDRLPPVAASGGAVAAYDFDGDGDIDLFVGGRVTPGRYPEAPRSFLLENKGGRFVDVTPDELKAPGMVTSAIWVDVHPGYEGNELVLAGVWMPIRIFHVGSDAGDGVAARALELTERMGLEHTAGWWNIVRAADLDGDGDIDLVAGNRGLNHSLKATPQEPVSLIYGDFGRDGTIDPILTYSWKGERYPDPWRDELLDQIPSLRRRFPDYRSYAEATLEEVLTPDQLGAAGRLDAEVFATSIFMNDGGGRFERISLPIEAQFAPINAIVVLDVNLDQRPDLILAGNSSATCAQWGPQSAGHGPLLINQWIGFASLSPTESGFYAGGDIRAMAAVNTSLGTLLVLTQNNSGVLT